MFKRSSWLHLRIPFSYYLMPVFFFSLAVSPNISERPLLWTFIIVHLFLYPASNGYNSYFDKDEKSIGGLKNPPKVSKGLYYLALLFDVIALVLAVVKISVLFAALIFIYGLVSKAYSHPAIRLKRYPVGGWLTVSFFQGFFTFVMCYIGINRFPLENVLKPYVLIPALLSSAMLLGTYPMTQVYQHEEDGKRGDKTFSLMLGIRGTFLFVGALFGVVSAGYILYFNSYFEKNYAWPFLIAMAPVVMFFLYWFVRIWRDESKADHKHTMWLNFISATCLNAFFIYLFLDSTQLLQMFS
ncbi:UbiA family prenyltransferase [Ohtaekwangia sp.]|uniref:UbiA family prenyltransferase n=1 Tax=Ohtaekwangia sp. TaxID=2066019 RepID=UPI002FDEB6F8